MEKATEKEKGRERVKVTQRAQREWKERVLEKEMEKEQEHPQGEQGGLAEGRWD